MKFTIAAALSAAVLATAQDLAPQEDAERDLGYYERCTPTGCCAWSEEALFCGKGHGGVPPQSHWDACNNECKHGGYYLDQCIPKTDYIPGCCWKPDHHGGYGHGESSGQGTCGNPFSHGNWTIPGRGDCPTDIDKTRCGHAGGCYCPFYDYQGNWKGDNWIKECLRDCMEPPKGPKGEVGCCAFDKQAKFCNGGVFGYTAESCHKAYGYFHTNVVTNGYGKPKCEAPYKPPGKCLDKKSCYYDKKTHDWYCNPWTAIPKGCECSVDPYTCGSCDGHFTPHP
mmetsp:Transcript_12544/g.23551  ORF Transcript_12544/g.23551 Transcript_12544/m.23551 type:complete len:282 (-) Transcript_12544:258-1103(-)|eukprot:CAMPEP_0197442184 /NCGR_PEP_ID=MMETSP1175-20131217/8259_1 /TAXON_ID=1003142 /ORGANISM="Triceratium dubium, Strain CCMP147" /LENGTH=281 /DNA_ID=CAMNT_0042972607 /DNA_START=157 /DNA_END=1002 /DNA_ORIENTATION=+